MVHYFQFKYFENQTRYEKYEIYKKRVSYITFDDLSNKKFNFLCPLSYKNKSQINSLVFRSTNLYNKCLYKTNFMKSLDLMK